MANGKHVLFKPDGGTIALDGAKPMDRINLRPAMMEWLRQFSDFAANQNIGIHCVECGADIVGRNADTDAMFSVACGCREWVGGNREYLKPMFQ